MDDEIEMQAVNPLPPHEPNPATSLQLVSGANLTSNAAPGANTAHSSARGEITSASDDDAQAPASGENTAGTREINPAHPASPVPGETGNEVRVDIGPPQNQPTNPPPPPNPYSFSAVNLIPKRLTRWKLFSTLFFVVLLGVTTYLLFIYVEEAKGKGGVCLQLYDDKIGWCHSTPIIIEVFSSVCCVMGIVFFLVVDEVKHLEWVREGHWASSLASFIFALLISIFPFFITPHTTVGFYSATAYHIFFWVVETSLAAKTNTNLHATFATINLSAASSLLLSDRDHLSRWIRPTIVLVLAAALHLISYEIIKKFPTPPPPPPAAPPAAPIPYELFWKVTHGTVRYCLWPFTGIALLALECCSPACPAVTFDGVMAHTTNCFNSCTGANPSSPVAA